MTDLFLHEVLFVHSSTEDLFISISSKDNVLFLLPYAPIIEYFNVSEKIFQMSSRCAIRRLSDKRFYVTLFVRKKERIACLIDIRNILFLSKKVKLTKHEVVTLVTDDSETQNNSTVNSTLNRTSCPKVIYSRLSDKLSIQNATKCIMLWFRSLESWYQRNRYCTHQRGKAHSPKTNSHTLSIHTVVAASLSLGNSSGHRIDKRSLRRMLDFLSEKVH
jgi:hypothetical protein